MLARVDVWVFWLGRMFWARLSKFVDTDAISTTGVDFNFTNSGVSTLSCVGGTVINLVERFSFNVNVL